MDRSGHYCAEIYFVTDVSTAPSTSNGHFPLSIVFFSGPGMCDDAERSGRENPLAVLLGFLVERRAMSVATSMMKERKPSSSPVTNLQHRTLNETYTTNLIVLPDKST